MIRAYEQFGAAGGENRFPRGRRPGPAVEAGRLAVVGRVLDSAQGVWADLWAELKPGVTPAGMVLPCMQHGFTPSCGWPEFLEKFWLLKHYLDCSGRMCQETSAAGRKS